MKSRFDHIEVHVSDVKIYCEFLVRIFEGGAFEVISPSGTSMFTSPEGVCIEVKKTKTSDRLVERGFCNPCLRRSEAKEFIQNLGFTVKNERLTPAGPVYFFDDHEGVTWHIKERSK
jgi:hypothetical protein